MLLVEESKARESVNVITRAVGKGRTSVPSAQWDRDPKLGPKEHSNEIRRWQLIMMMSRVVAPAESTVGLR